MIVGLSCWRKISLSLADGAISAFPQVARLGFTIRRCELGELGGERGESEARNPGG
jgi:hypothetical protein